MTRTLRCLLVTAKNVLEAAIFEDHLPVQRTFEVLAVVALAVRSTENSSLKALAVLFETGGPFARAALLMPVLASRLHNVLHTNLGGKLGPEGVFIPFEDRYYTFSAHLFELEIIVAVVAIAVPTVVSAGKALAVKLQTFGVFAVALPFSREVGLLLLHLLLEKRIKSRQSGRSGWSV